MRYGVVNVLVSNMRYGAVNVLVSNHKCMEIIVIQ